MKVVVLRSKPGRHEINAAEEYHQVFDSRYAERVMNNLIDADAFCTACGPACINCRQSYRRRFGAELAGVVEFPAVLPYLLEKPGDYMQALPRHDILLAINIHEQILLEVLNRCGQWGTRGVIVPIESPDWIHGNTISMARGICENNGIEIDFPKPFCSFNPPEGSLLREFKDHFHIGYPRIEITVENRKITKAFVHSSAPCGSTYFIARWLVGRSVDDDLKYEIVAGKLHAYPCTASTQYDPEIGDSILHLAANNHLEMFNNIGNGLIEKPDRPVFLSPHGVILPAPVSAQDNIRNVDAARKAILDELGRHAPLSLHKFEASTVISPAAIYAALLALKRDGKIKMLDGNITKTSVD